MTISKIRPEEAVISNGRMSRVMTDWVSQATKLLSGQEPQPVPRKTVQELGQLDAAKMVGTIAICTNEGDGEILCWCDGTTWRRSSDGAEITI